MRPPGPPEPPGSSDPTPDATRAPGPDPASDPTPGHGRPAAPDGDHVDPSRLAAAALGDAPGPADAAHLARCAPCRGELQELVDLVALGRDPGDAPAVPLPPGLWDRIAAEAGVPVEPARPVPEPARAVDARPSAQRPVLPTAPAPASASASERPAVVPLGGVGGSPGPRVSPPSLPRPRRSRRALPVAAALVVGVGLGAVGLGLVRPVDDPTSPVPSAPAPAVLAAADLAPLASSGGAPEGAAGGTAVVRTDGGGRTLEVDVTDLPATSGYYELWLLDPAGGVVALGVVAGDRVVVGLPDDLDLARYPVVDVSAEAFDGDPGHSADSVLRGTLAL